MVDRSLRGPVERISPEAPVPVVDVQERTQTPGGAGNVICNLAALGAKPTLVALRGDDSLGKEVETELRALGVNVSGLLADPHRPTISKTLVIAGHQQVVRLDVEKRGPVLAEVLRQLVSRLKNLIPQQRAVIISDYGKGVVTPPVIRAALTLAHRKKIPVVVDPKIEHFMQYRGVDGMTPNTKEATEGLRVLPPKNENEFVDLGGKILRRLRLKSLLITRGEKGMALFQNGSRPLQIPALAQEVFDVTGAGDTVVATFTLARAAGAPYLEAAELANLAASLVVAKVGTAVATREELAARIKDF